MNVFIYCLSCSSKAPVGLVSSLACPLDLASIAKRMVPVKADVGSWDAEA